MGENHTPGDIYAQRAGMGYLQGNYLLRRHPSLLSVREAARLLEVSPATIYKLCAVGELSFVRILSANERNPSGVTSHRAGRAREGGRREPRRAKARRERTMQLP